LADFAHLFTNHTEVKKNKFGGKIAPKNPQIAATLNCHGATLVPKALTEILHVISNTHSKRV
jgi:hypothetical protein